jgi:hypothetical protein
MKTPREVVLEVERLALLAALNRALDELLRVRGSAGSLVALKSDLKTVSRDLVSEAAAAEGVAVEDEARIREDAIEGVAFALVEACRKSAEALRSRISLSFSPMQSTGNSNICNSPTNSIGEPLIGFAAAALDQASTAK